MGRSILIFIVMLACFVLFVHAAPQSSTAYPHIVNIEINNLFLYTVSKQVEGDPLSSTNLQTILETLLTKHHVTLDHVDSFPVLSVLKWKVKRMYQNASAKAKQGGKSMKNLLERWQTSTYSLILSHMTGSPKKRKLETDLSDQIAKRQKLEDDVAVLKDQLEQSRDEKHESERKLHRLQNSNKKRQGQRGKAKNKVNYKRAQTYKHRTDNIEAFRSSVIDTTANTNFTPLCLTVREESGMVTEIEFTESNVQVCQDDINEMLFVLDTFNISIKGYHEITQLYPNLPRTGAIQRQKKNINQQCPLTNVNIKHQNNILTGVVRSVREALASVLIMPEKYHLSESGTVKIKLSGDGTRAGKKKHFVNFSFTIIGESTCKSEQGNYLLAIVQCPETNECIKATLGDLIEEFESLTSIEIHGKTVVVQKYLGGDLKFLNQIIGIGGFASTYSCLWCKCPKDLRFDMSKSWSVSDTTKGARTIEEICQLSTKKKNNFNCVSQPLFQSVPLINVVPDTLHLFIRIADQMVYHVIKYLQDLDNHIKLTSNSLDKFKHLQRFKDFIISIGISDWYFFVSDGKLKYDSFTGPEHRMIMAKINLASLVPEHPKLTQLQCIWTSFVSLMEQLNQDMSTDEIDNFEQAARNWVDMYSKLYQSKDVTPYMHILACHLPEAMREHGNVVDFCQQGLEKLNDQVTKWYFRSTNYHQSALSQIMHKQHRIRSMEYKCRRPPKFQLTCTKCKSPGHNKRTCDKQAGP